MAIYSTTARLTNERDETLLLISGDIGQSVAGQARAAQFLPKLTAVMFPPELSEPGVPTVDLPGSRKLINCKKSSKKAADQTRSGQVRQRQQL